MRHLSLRDWRTLQQFHHDLLAPFAADRVERQALGVKHPVRDFLFEYYAYRPAHLLRWSPGVDVVLEDANLGDFPWNEFEQVEGGLLLATANFPQHRRSFVTWAISYLEGIAERPPSFSCFGLHEWAMVYRAQEVRHARTPLRLSPKEIAEFVESEGLRCTHFDAYRFFTPEAVPLNRWPLARAATTEHDQKGCLHVTMDLYRYAFKLTPWCAAEILADSFLLAWDVRHLDMRASPYDLREFGIEPLLIETRDGRDEYVARQREFTQRGEPIRRRLLQEYYSVSARNEAAVSLE